MRLGFPLQLVAPAVAVVLMNGSPQARQLSSSEASQASATAAEKELNSGTAPKTGLDVPVSLDKIREALTQPSPAEPLKGLDDQPTFHLQVLERQKFQQIMDTIKFEGGGGPEVAGGRANYDMQQLLFPKVDNPLVQPYAQFSTGEVLTLAAEAVVEKVITQKVSHVFGDMLRAQAEREAREEVARSLAGLPAAQPASSPKD